MIRGRPVIGSLSSIAPIPPVRRALANFTGFVTTACTVRLIEVEADSLDDAWWQMQGENWSPHGEARPLLESLGLGHTSMSIGDVIRDEEGLYWECVERGWRCIEDNTQGDEGHGQA